jgi:hypothetical protein
MAIVCREILDDELEVARTILDAAYGPSPTRAVRLRRYRSLDPMTWLLALDTASPFPAAATASTDRRSWRRGRGFDREVRLIVPDGRYASECIASGGHPAEGRERQMGSHQRLARRG